MNLFKKNRVILLVAALVASVWVYLPGPSSRREKSPEKEDPRQVSSDSGQVEYGSPEELIRKGLEHEVLVDGFVRDEEGNPVAGAEVMVSLPLADASKSPLSLTTDSKGGFKIEGVRSPTLFLNALPPAGYVRTPDSQKKIEFFVGTKKRLPKGSKMDFSLKGEFRNPRDPVVLFVKAIKGAEPVYVRRKSAILPKDGQGRYFAVDGPKGGSLSESEVGGHQVMVQCRTDLANRIPTTQRGANYRHVYSWRFRISVPGGGVARASSSGEDEVMAPETGYQEFIEISMDRDVKEESWKSDGEMRVYFKFPDSTYGRGEVKMETHGSHFVRVDSVYNPSGSRNTLVDERKLLGEED